MKDILWAPWRINYIKTKKQRGCIFCNAIKSKGKDYVIFETKYSFAMLNIFPYNNGHVMVSPLRHIKEIEQLKDVEALDLFRSLNKVKKLLNKVMKPDGYNIGINISKAAGAGFTGHLHIHIVPRWQADTNFMCSVADAKVIPQSLEELYKQLKNAESKTD